MPSYVYKITNLANGKCYVGKTSRPLMRWSEHCRTARKDGAGYYLHAAIRVYGEDSFRYEVVSEHATEAEAFAAERALVRELCCFESARGYNLNWGGEGGLRPTASTRQKLSAAARRYRHSPETIEKLREAHKRRGRQRSPETRAKLSARASKRVGPLSGAFIGRMRKHFAAEGFSFSYAKGT